MKKASSYLILSGLLILLVSAGGFAQFHASENARYLIYNAMFNRSDNSWLQLEGAPETFRETKLALGPLNTSGSGNFRCFPKKPGYQFQFKFEDGTWGVLEIENTFKKEGAHVNLVHDDVKGDNFIVHPQRFLIQEAYIGHFIRSMDGRYLRYVPEKQEVVLSAENPAKYKEHDRDRAFMWIITTPMW